jgi:hypothetical protein
MSPSTGRTITRTVQSTFVPVSALLCKDIDDRPDVGDQDNQTEYALVLHAAPRFEYLGHHN